MDWILIIGIIIVILLIVFIISLYNGLVKAKNRVKNAWAQIDVQLNRRADLIPNLIETVKGYAKHEKSTLKDKLVDKKNNLDAEKHHLIMTNKPKMLQIMQKSNVTTIGLPTAV